MRTGTRIDIEQTIRKNKPEFDGRFFVKILKDSIIEKYIYRSAPVKTYVVKHARRHFTIAGTGDEKRDFWRDQGSGGTSNNSWQHVINETQNGDIDFTNWFIDYAVGAYQGNNLVNDHSDQGIGFYKPPSTGTRKGTFLQFSYSHLK